jgi:hypothetical protein
MERETSLEPAEVRVLGKRFLADVALIEGRILVPAEFDTLPRNTIQ